jgi:hypothetical protein
MPKCCYTQGVKNDVVCVGTPKKLPELPSRELFLHDLRSLPCSSHPYDADNHKSTLQASLLLLEE